MLLPVLSRHRLGHPISCWVREYPNILPGLWEAPAAGHPHTELSITPPRCFFARVRLAGVGEAQQAHRGGPRHREGDALLAVEGSFPHEQAPDAPAGAGEHPVCFLQYHRCCTRRTSMCTCLNRYVACRNALSGHQTDSASSDCVVSARIG